MIIKLPSSVRFPITITELLKEANTEVARLEPLLVYTYKTKVTVYPEYGVELLVEKELSSQFDAPIGGKLARWVVTIGTVVENSRFVTWSAGTGSRGSRRRADRADDSVPIVEIDEPCTHEVQFAGLCTMCGEDMTM